MSGGRFDYKQYELDNIAEQIGFEIERNGRPKTKEELKEHWGGPEWYEKYPEDKFHTQYPEEVLVEFKNAVEIIKKAAIYMHEIDWLLSGDTGNKSFLERLKQKLCQE